MLMSIGGLVPLPSDALVTPVTFRVRQRNLRGILSEFDALEDGLRELSGEWVVGKKLWQRLQTEWKDGRKVTTTANDRARDKSRERVVLYFHGGMWIFAAFSMRTPLLKWNQAHTIYRVPQPRDCFLYRCRSMSTPASSVRTHHFSSNYRYLNLALRSS